MPDADLSGFAWPQILQIVLLDVLLAGDNAVVIAMAVRLLPPREQRLGRLWGTIGAVALRVLFLLVAAWLLAVPWLQFAGGLLLVWIAWKLLAPGEHGVVSADAGGGPAVRARTTLRAAVVTIVLADASMSLDNVIAVTGAAQGHFGLAAAGIALSVPLVVWGSVVLGRIMEHHRWIVWLGGGVLGHVAGVLLVAEPELERWLPKVTSPGWHPVALGLGALAFGYGVWASRHVRRRPDPLAPGQDHGASPH